MEKGALGSSCRGRVQGRQGRRRPINYKGEKSLINVVSHAAGTYSSRPAFPQICTCLVTTTDFIRGSCLRACRVKDGIRSILSTERVNRAGPPVPL